MSGGLWNTKPPPERPKLRRGNTQGVLNQGFARIEPPGFVAGARGDSWD
jgi:hypothetical protein